MVRIGARSPGNCMNGLGERILVVKSLPAPAFGQVLILDADLPNRLDRLKAG
jgi:hypothetical protein